jgi:hypothetical protein
VAGGSGGSNRQQQLLLAGVAQVARSRSSDADARPRVVGLGDSSILRGPLANSAAQTFIEVIRRRAFVARTPIAAAVRSYSYVAAAELQEGRIRPKLKCRT